MPKIDLVSYVELPHGDRALLSAALSEGRGVIFVSAHLGAWSLLAQRIRARGLRLRDPGSQRRQSFSRRLAGGAAAAGTGGDGSTAVILARRGRSSRRCGAGPCSVRWSIKTPRWSRCSCPSSADSRRRPLRLLSSRSARSCPSSPASSRRKKDGGHAIRLERIELPSPESAEKVARVRELTARITGAIEGAIRETPDEWVWFHARWKSPPPEA